MGALPRSGDAGIKCLSHHQATRGVVGRAWATIGAAAGEGLQPGGQQRICRQGRHGDVGPIVIRVPKPTSGTRRRSRKTRTGLAARP